MMSDLLSRCAASKLLAETFGLRIREEREKLGRQPHVLADALQISPDELSDIESGKRLPTCSELHQVARFLKLSASALLTPLSCPPKCRYLGICGSAQDGPPRLYNEIEAMVSKYIADEEGRPAPAARRRTCDAPKGRDRLLTFSR